MSDRRGSIVIEKESERMKEKEGERRDHAARGRRMAKTVAEM